MYSSCSAIAASCFSVRRSEAAMAAEYSVVAGLFPVGRRSDDACEGAPGNQDMTAACRLKVTPGLRGARRYCYQR